ncbi:histone modifying enzyme [Lithospermum erythrorhizon]|uniref:Histone modifying enzyme n=1 Tax=Lithospermum erythrorhizon TaxID=34254 RepID=A0AAV3NIQ9_LITER
MALECNMSSVDVSPWLKSLPVAPEYHPTLVEFQDPIAYIFKIEKEASQFGICKIVPPIPSSPKKTAIVNFNRSLLARAEDTGSCPVFTTRQQQIGFCPRRHNRPVQKPVWQSGESYTLGEFEAKAKGFERSFLKKGSKKCLSALEIESVYWKAMLDKPFTVEYANDMPGSAFIVRKDKGEGFGSSNVTVGDTDWNMRGVSRAKGSLLRFMKEEIPGVTSPMVYIAMLFSWFAWHVEDHDLHSLNYLHTGAGKTWYGVPRDAAVAFEEVIRVHGYGGEINPLVTFATLAEKTTVMSPEVLVNAGVPCCRLVQNPGEFVVTFPRAYHSGFSHGFNCGEASNIATPEWLMVAKDAAVRRASINCSPMVSHFQLLYDLAFSICSRVPKNIHIEPRSSRLKDKKKVGGDILVKDLFVQDVLQNNSLLHTIGKGSPVIILPQVKSGSTLPGDSQLKVKSRLFHGLCSPDLVVKTRKGAIADSMAPRNQDNHMTGSFAVKGKYSALCDGNLPVSGRADQVVSTLGSGSRSMDPGRDGDPRSDRVSSQGLFSCVTCGILCFSSVAVIQPTETASQYLMSGDFSRFIDHVGADDLVDFNKNSTAHKSNSSGSYALPYKHTVIKQSKVFMVGARLEQVVEKDYVVVKQSQSLFDIPIQTADQNQLVDHSVVCNNGMTNGTSLGLLAMTYGDCSDSEDDGSEADVPDRTSEINMTNSISEGSGDCDNAGNGYNRSEGLENKSCCLETKISSPSANSNFGRGVYIHSESKTTAVAPTLDEDSSRMHIFCLQHALQVEEQLQTIGGAHIHHDDISGSRLVWWDMSMSIYIWWDSYMYETESNYPMLEEQAKQVADEMGNDNYWNDISYREANLEDEEIIQSALDSEEAIHGNGDWAVKLGINLYYTANLSRSPLYSKQMPYNSMIYSAFGRKSPGNMSDHATWLGRHRKVIVAGKWCGKVWTASQVHPMLTEGEPEEDHMRNIPASKKPSLKIERSSKGVKTDGFTPCKSHRKRKVVAEASEVVKAESPRAYDSPDEVLTDYFTSRKSRRKRKAVAKASELVKSESPKAYDSSDEVLENLRVSVKRPKISSRYMKVREESFEPQINDDETDSHSEEELQGGPSTRLRKRTAKPSDESERKSNATTTRRNKSGRKIMATAKSRNGPGRKIETKTAPKKQPTGRFTKRGQDIKEAAHSKNSKMRVEEAEYQCNIENCSMSFDSKQELALHKKNICPVKGCGKKFFSHKYLVQHRRVHMDDRPLKCPWKGCKMTFKWAWARTEHIRVHTGERPYVCTESGCGQTFRFVSDFSRHKRKTGHSTKKVNR